MALTISDSISERAWGDVDKTALRQRLVDALEQKESGAAEAIRETYAVIRSDNLGDAPSQNWWGPHHEIRSNQIVLSRNGVHAAVGALAGARGEPDLTADERRQAARHLARHYRDLEEEPPETLRRLAL